MSAQLHRELGTGGVRIEAEHLTAVRAQQLYGELPDQSQADHSDLFAQSRGRLAHSL